VTTEKSKAEPAAVAAWRRRWRPAAEGARLYGMVMLGGVLGSLLRWLVGLLLPQSQGGLPWGTFAANASGCFVIGFYAALTGPDGRVFVGPLIRQFVMIGICGGYTTFSAFSLETFRFLAAGDYGSAALYLAISLASWLAAVWLGDALAWRLNDYGRL
jgi:fluoride exporter